MLRTEHFMTVKTLKWKKNFFSAYITLSHFNRSKHEFGSKLNLFSAVFQKKTRVALTL